MQGTATITIKIDDMTRSPITFIEKTKYTGDFQKFYVTASANETILLGIFENSNADIDYPSSSSDATGSTQCDTNQIAVDDTATIILPAESAGIKESEVTNTGDNIIYIGGSGVTISDGHRLMPDESKSFSFYSGDLYGICDTGLTSSVSYFKAV